MATTETPRTAQRYVLLGSAVVGVLLLAAAGFGIWIWPLLRADVKTADIPKANVARTRVHGAVPSVHFTDITESAGIRFRHTNGAFGKKLLPETMGSGVAFIDFDNDGRQDILFVN